LAVIVDASLHGFIEFSMNVGSMERWNDGSMGEWMMG